VTEDSIKVEALNFEEALAELERIVGRLESGQGSLDDAIKAYERGSDLKKHCQKKLDEARMKVEKIRLPESGGAAETSDFES
jgi:exodeoxyribonuclease VII small subunit